MLALQLMEGSVPEISPKRMDSTSMQHGRSIIRGQRNTYLTVGKFSRDLSDPRALPITAIEDALRRSDIWFKMLLTKDIEKDLMLQIEPCLFLLDLISIGTALLQRDISVLTTVEKGAAGIEAQDGLTMSTGMPYILFSME